MHLKQNICYFTFLNAESLCHEFNFLGTIIHETLEWTRHIDKGANKISRTLGILNKLNHILLVYTLKTMYDALIVPHLHYNILLWGFNSIRMSKLQKGN